MNEGNACVSLDCYLYSGGAGLGGTIWSENNVTAEVGVELSGVQLHLRHLQLITNDCYLWREKMFSTLLEGLRYM